MNNNFLNALDDWGSIISNTYENNLNILELIEITFDKDNEIIIDGTGAVVSNNIIIQTNVPIDIESEYRNYGRHRFIEANTDLTKINLLYKNKDTMENLDVYQYNDTYLKEKLFVFNKLGVDNYVFIYYPFRYNLSHYIKYTDRGHVISNICDYDDGMIININEKVLSFITEIIHKETPFDKDMINGWNKIKKNIKLFNNKKVKNKRINL